MAYISLGTRNLQIGGLPRVYDDIETRRGRSYIFVTDTTIEVPSNLYSFIRFSFRATSSEITGVFLPQVIDLTPIVGQQSIELITPAGIPDRLDIQIYAQRIPRIFGTGDTAGDINLEILYDENLSARV